MMTMRNPTLTRLSVAMIVRDCVALLPATLDSIQDLADEIVIVVTGSADRTREMVKSRATRLVEFPWCDDFSAARNAALDHVTGDYVLWLDAGETISAENHQLLRQFLDAQARPTSAYLLMVDLPGQQAAAPHELTARLRLHPHREDLNWFGRIREQLRYDPLQGELQITIAPGTIERGTRENDPSTRRVRAERNLRLADLDQTNFGPSARIELVRGEAFCELEQFAQSAAAYRRALALTPRGSTEALEAYYGWLTVYDAWPERHEEQLAVAAAGLAQFPLDAQLLCAAGNYLQARGLFELAARSYQTAAEHGQVNLETWHLENILEVATSCWAVSLEQCGEATTALALIEDLAKAETASPALLRQLLNMYISRDQRASALSLVSRLAIPIQQRDAFRNMLRGACLAAKAHWSQAWPLLQSAWNGDCRDTLCFRWLAQTLLAQGEYVTLKPFLLEWEKLEPGSADLKRIAGLTMASLARQPGQRKRVDPVHPLPLPVALAREQVAFPMALIRPEW